MWREHLIPNQCTSLHKCETPHWRKCRTCEKYSCNKFIRGECRRCARKREYHAKHKLDFRWRERSHANGRRWYERNKERVLARMRAYIKIRRSQYKKWCADRRKQNILKARAAGLRCEWRRRHPGEEVPSVYACRDCNQVFAWHGSKLDAVCRRRACRSIHVFVLPLPRARKRLAGQMPPLGEGAGLQGGEDSRRAVHGGGPA